MGNRLKKNLPVLRFPEFEGDWEEKKLDELIQIKSGYAFSSSFFSAKETDKILLTPGNFHVNGSLYFGSNTKYYEGEVNEEYVLSNGDLLIVMTDLTKEMNILGNSIFLKSNKTVLHNQRIGKILIKDNLLVTRHFLRDVLNLDAFKENIRKSATGSTVRHTSNKSILSISTFFPTIAEQEKIASFLGAVDTRISQLRRKHELLQTYKRGVMQKIFSQQIRFKCDRGKLFPDWEEKELKSIAIVNPSSNHLPDKFFYIDLERVTDGRLSEPEYIDKDNAPSRAQRVLQQGDILYQTVRPYQRNNLFFDLQGSYVASTGYAQLRSKVDKRFLYYLVYSDGFVDEVISRCTGTSYPAINSSDLAGISVFIPESTEEQEKIADFLTAIDQKIEAVAQQIKLTEKFKKGLLQKMFV